MRTIKIFDSTIESARVNGLKLSFKQKLDVVKLLDESKVNVIRLGKIGDDKESVVFVRTLAVTVKNSELCCSVGFDKSEVDRAVAALKDAASKRLVVDVPSSPALLEYKVGKKPQAVLSMIEETLRYISALGVNAEVSFIDAANADEKFLLSAIDLSAKLGVKEFTLCEKSSAKLPDEFAKFVSDLVAKVGDKEISFFVSVKNSLGLSLAHNCAAILAGANGVDVSAVDADSSDLRSVVSLFSAVGADKGVRLDVITTAVNRIADEITEILGGDGKSSTLSVALIDDMILPPTTTREEFSAVIGKLGYALSYDDSSKVYEAFSRIINKKGRVNVRELDALIAAYSAQVPSEYKIVDYIINTGNAIRTTASLTMERAGETTYGLSTGDGPIDAAFHAIESITGTHFELDEFKIESLTEGKDAAGRAIVKLRKDGIVYVGAGVSTDIVGASVHAYVAALNKIAFSEKNGEEK